MKHLIFLFITLLSIASCKKDTIQPTDDITYEVMSLDTMAALKKTVFKHEVATHLREIGATVTNTVVKVVEQDTLTMYSVQLESLDSDATPFIITQPEFMRRMKEMSQSGGGGMFGMSNMPEMYNLVVNANSELANSILQANEATQKELVKNALDLAKLSQGLLKGEDLTAFVKRSFETLK